MRSRSKHFDLPADQVVFIDDQPRNVAGGSAVAFSLAFTWILPIHSKHRAGLGRQ